MMDYNGISNTQVQRILAQEIADRVGRAKCDCKPRAKWKVIAQLDSRDGVSGYAIVTEQGIFFVGPYRRDAVMITNAHNASLK